MFLFFAPAIAHHAPKLPPSVVQRQLIDLAKEAIRDEVLGKPAPSPAQSDRVYPVFVTIESHGKVIGCQGDLSPQTPSLETEIIRIAQAASVFDPRYHPLDKSQLSDFQVTITLVGDLVPTDTVDGLLPADGLVLKSGDRYGIVLPWEGKDPHLRLKWAYQKAGAPIGSAASLSILYGVRFRG